MDVSTSDGVTLMSYEDEKQIALLRIELRTCLNGGDRAGAHATLAKLARFAGNDNELAAELRRWSSRFAM